MSRAGVVCAALFALGALLRLHNAWVAPPLSGFDGPYHAAYIGILHFEGRLPLPHESWSTYHPPLYYALAAGLWELLPGGWSAQSVLFALRLLSVVSGLTVAWVALRCGRMLFPDRPALPVFAAALCLFLPMHLGPASTLGNELPAAALCALALPLLLRSLARPESLRRATDLGVVLGLALLTKFNALAALAGSAAALLQHGLALGGPRLRALRAPLAAGLAVALVSSGYFARNWLEIGTPILLEAEVSARVMARHGYGPPRPLAAYFSLRPDLLIDPADRSPAAQGAVWPATFASTWFDLHGAAIDPRAPWARRLAPLLLACGAAFTALALLGLLALASGRVRPALPGAGAALCWIAGFTLASYVAFTWRVATFSTLKATLLSPAVVPFSLFAALGCDLAARSARPAALAVAGLVGVLALTTTALFWSGGLAPTGRSPASLYLSAYADAPTLRVFDYFERGRRRGR